MAFLKPALRATVLLWQAWLLCIVAAPARAGDALERSVKAAYLYKFASYVEWPEGTFPRADSPVIIGVANAPELAAELERMVAGRSVDGHPLQVRRVAHREGLAGLHILFLGAPVNGALLAAARGHPLLTVTDSDDALALGSMINFLVADDRLRFEVALRPAAQARLHISSRVLAVATRVLPAAP